MQRWIFNSIGEDPKVDAFLAEVIEVCKKHGMSISHEVGHGAFEVATFDRDAADRLMKAHSYVPIKE